ncbi:MAG TPA: VOC family protein [Hyphomicrobiaceae bacterium]|nr:VOC family protein [Hyphomicrobiaceae bacterium]
MAWKRLIPMLSVRDLKRTIAFYREELGFELVASFGDPEPVWCHLKRDQTHFMFNAPGESDLEAIPARARDFQIFYIYPDDVTVLHGDLAAKGLSVTPLRITLYGMREFELRDPDGHWLWFGETTTEPPTLSE